VIDAQREQVIQEIILAGNSAKHLANSVRRLVNGHAEDSNHRRVRDKVSKVLACVSNLMESFAIARSALRRG
jgi:hypothetical protein